MKNVRDACFSFVLVAALFHFAPRHYIAPRTATATVYVPVSEAPGVERRCGFAERAECRAICAGGTISPDGPTPQRPIEPPMTTGAFRPAPRVRVDSVMVGCEVRTVTGKLSLVCECGDPSNQT